MATLPSCRGATSDIEFNIYLDLPHPRTRPVASHAPSKLLTHKSKQYYLPTFFYFTDTREIGSQTEELPVGMYVQLCTFMKFYEDPRNSEFEMNTHQSI